MYKRQELLSVSVADDFFLTEGDTTSEDVIVEYTIDGGGNDTSATVALMITDFVVDEIF